MKKITKLKDIPIFTTANTERLTKSFDPGNKVFSLWNQRNDTQITMGPSHHFTDDYFYLISKNKKMKLTIYFLRLIILGLLIILGFLI